MAPEAGTNGTDTSIVVERPRYKLLGPLKVTGDNGANLTIKAGSVKMKNSEVDEPDVRKPTRTVKGDVRGRSVKVAVEEVEEILCCAPGSTS